MEPCKPCCDPPASTPPAAAQSNTDSVAEGDVYTNAVNTLLDVRTTDFAAFTNSTVGFPDQEITGVFYEMPCQDVSKLDLTLYRDSAVTYADSFEVVAMRVVGTTVTRRVSSWVRSEDFEPAEDTGFADLRAVVRLDGVSRLSPDELLVVGAHYPSSPHNAGGGAGAAVALTYGRHETSSRVIDRRVLYTRAGEGQDVVHILHMQPLFVMYMEYDCADLD